MCVSLRQRWAISCSLSCSRWPCSSSPAPAPSASQHQPPSWSEPASAAGSVTLAQRGVSRLTRVQCVPSGILFKGGAPLEATGKTTYAAWLLTALCDSHGNLLSLLVQMCAVRQDGNADAGQADCCPRAHHH